MSKNKSTYGAVSTTNAESGDVKEGTKDFKETDLLYYKGPTLSPREKRMKIIKIAVPIIVAILLIGGLTLFLLRGFGNLYPGPGGGQKVPERAHAPSRLPHSKGGDSGSAPVSPPVSVPASDMEVPKPPTTSATASAGSSKITTTSTIPSSPSSSTTTTTTTSSSGSSNGSSCEDNTKCSALGLTGQCCPTNKGDMLDCCG